MRVEDLRQGQLVWATLILGDEDTEEEIAAIENLPVERLPKPATVIATQNGLAIVESDRHVRNVRENTKFLDVAVAMASDVADEFHPTLAEAIEAGARLCDESAVMETRRAAAMRRLAERVRGHAETNL